MTTWVWIFRTICATEYEGNRYFLQRGYHKCSFWSLDGDQISLTHEEFEWIYHDLPTFLMMHRL